MMEKVFDTKKAKKSFSEHKGNRRSIKKYDFPKWHLSGHQRLKYAFACGEFHFIMQ